MAICVRLGLSALLIAALGTMANADQSQPPEPEKAQKPEKAHKPEKAQKASTSDADGVPGGLSLMTLRPRSSAPARGAQGVDLFPPDLFGRDGLLHLPMHANKSERRRGMSLGSDGSWKVQAAQVGAMVAGWAALVGLCGGGKCMLPDNWLPGPLQTSKQVVPNPRPPQRRPSRDLGR